MVVGSCEDNIVRVDGLNGGGNTNVVRSISTIFSVDSKEYLIDQIVKNGIVSKNDLNILRGYTIKELEKVCRYEILITEIVGKNIDFCVILKISSNLSEEKLKIIKDNKELISEIAGIDSLSVRDLDNYGKTLSKLTKEDLEKIRSIKDLMEEITGESIGIYNLCNFWRVLRTLPREKLEKIWANKDLIKKITGEKNFCISRFLNSFVGLIELKREDLEHIIYKKNFFLKNVNCEGNIELGRLYDFSKLTMENIEDIGNNKILIKEITGIDYNYINDINDIFFIIRFKKEDLEKIRDNKDLILEITGMNSIPIENLKDLIGIEKEDLEKIRDNKDLIKEITGIKRSLLGVYIIRISDLKDLIGIEKEDLEKIRDNEGLIRIITGKNLDVSELNCFSTLTKQDLKKIETICNNFGINIQTFSDRKVDGIFDGEDKLDIENYDGWYRFSNEPIDLKHYQGYGKYLLQFDKRTVDYCRYKHIHDLWMIVMVDRIMKNLSNVSNYAGIRNYIERKQQYLLKCRQKDKQLIGDDEYEELFSKKIYVEDESGKKQVKIKKGKYKGEINQGKLGYCFFYAVCNSLKRMNFFDLLVKTNLRKNENGDGWQVRLPMLQSDGKWISVGKDEIDRKYNILDINNDGFRENVPINSDSPLGFKIMEIAYIKKNLIERYESVNQEFLDTGDVMITGKRIIKTEGGMIGRALTTLLGRDYVINGNSRPIEKEEFFDVVFNILVDTIFDNFDKGLIVGLSVKDKLYEENDTIIKGEMDDETIIAKVIGKKVKIINKDSRSLKDLTEVVESDGKKRVEFYGRHAYSVEKCYNVIGTGEKRVWVVNPWHTGIKFDMSLDLAKKIFNWDVVYVNIGNMFNN